MKTSFRRDVLSTTAYNLRMRIDMEEFFIPLHVIFVKHIHTSTLPEYGEKNTTKSCCYIAYNRKFNGSRLENNTTFPGKTLRSKTHDKYDGLVKYDGRKLETLRGSQLKIIFINIMSEFVSRCALNILTTIRESK